MGFFDDFSSAAAGGLGGGIASMGLNLIGGMFGSSREEEERRQLAMLEKQYALQMKYNRLQADYSSKLSREMWDYTNYENQVKHMKAAGLNPALMYKGAGAGGSTSGAGAAAPISGGDPMLGLSAQLATAQIEKTKAEAAKTAAEAGKVAKEAQGTETNTEKTKEEIKGIIKDNRLADYNIQKEEFEKRKREALERKTASMYVNGEETGKVTFYEMWADNEFQRIMAEHKENLSKSEKARYERAFFNRLETFAEDLAAGEYYKAQSEAVKYIREGNQQKYEEWQQQQDMALTKAIDKAIEGAGEYTKTILQGIKLLLSFMRKGGKQ